MSLVSKKILHFLTKKVKFLIPNFNFELLRCWFIMLASLIDRLIDYAYCRPKTLETGLFYLKNTKQLAARLSTYYPLF